MGKTFRNTIRTINRLRKEASKHTKSNPERAYTLLEKARSLAKGYPFSTRALTVANARILYVLADCHFLGNQLDTALLHASHAAELFQQAGEIDEHIRVILLMQAIYHHKGDSGTALELLQSCLPLENKTNNRQLIGQIQGSIAVLLATLGDSHRAIQHFQQALSIAEECKNYMGICQTLSNIAISHTSSGRLLPALECLLKALSVAEKIGLHKERTMGNILMRIGNTLRLVGNYDQALDYTARSLTLLEQHGSLIEVGAVLKYMGLLYQDKEEYSLARTYLVRALSIHDGRNGAQQVRINSKVALAQVELLLGNIDEARSHVLEALHMSEIINDIRREGDALAILAEISAQQQDYTAARTYYQQSLDAHSREENVHAKVSTLVGIGIVLICQAQYDEALEQLHTARTLAEQTTIKPLLLSVHQALAEAYEYKGDSKCALEHFKLFYEIEKQLFNEKTEQNMQALKILHQVEQIEKESAIQKQDNEQLQQNIAQVQNALTVHVLQLAQQSDLLQKAKSELSTVITQQLPVLQKKISSALGGLKQDFPDIKTKRASSRNKAVLYIADTLASAEKETLSSVHESLQSIVRKFDDALLGQSMWQAFEQQFEQIHSGFMETLAQRCPQLSTTEMKVCSLIKINLSSKEIGHILNVSLRSVETYRYNIRKKLGLTAKDNLIQFIVELS